MAKYGRGPDYRGFCCIGGEEMEQTALTAISTVGFPIVVTFYLLTSFQKSMDRLSGEIARLTEFLQVMEREHKAK